MSETQKQLEVTIIPPEDPQDVRNRDGIAPEPIGRQVMQTFKIVGGDREATPVGRHAPSGQAALAITNGQHVRH